MTGRRDNCNSAPGETKKKKVAVDDDDLTMISGALGIGQSDSDSQVLSGGGRESNL